MRNIIDRTIKETMRRVHLKIKGSTDRRIAERNLPVVPNYEIPESILKLKK